ncbi:unnamed protein product [Rhizophagus irregularis]|nr:unnamed protein product [Rhizophagus irregularis]
MSPSQSVNINWSSTSQNSFIQLGTSTSPNIDSENFLHDTEPPTVLTSKDIFFLDIDDIFPFTYSTLHFEELEPEDYTNEINDYFKSLLNTTLVEEITLTRDDIPTTNNLFELQETPTYTDTPIIDNMDSSDTPVDEITSTHIDAPMKDGPSESSDTLASTDIPIMDNEVNLETPPIDYDDDIIPPTIIARPAASKDFAFKISFKKFHVTRIHKAEHKELSITSSCDIPSPFVKSNNRHGCGLHFHKKYLSKTIAIRNDEGIIVDNNRLENKKRHADLIYH